MFRAFVVMAESGDVIVLAKNKAQAKKDFEAELPEEGPISLKKIRKWDPKKDESVIPQIDFGDGVEA